jgi:hypothetical protein
MVVGTELGWAYNAMRYFDFLIETTSNTDLFPGLKIAPECLYPTAHSVTRMKNQTFAEKILDDWLNVDLRYAFPVEPRSRPGTTTAPTFIVKLFESAGILEDPVEEGKICRAT